MYCSSYGHQSAKLYDVADGYKSKKTVDEAQKVKLGLAITRQSVLKVFRPLFELCGITIYSSGLGTAVSCLRLHVCLASIFRNE